MDQILFTKKVPTTKDNYVGIEIEFLIKNNQETKLIKLLNENKLQWNVSLGQDNSVRDDNWQPNYVYRRDEYGNLRMDITNYSSKKIGKEIRIIATEKEFPEYVEKVCDILKKVNAEVNNTCGLHVHIDMRNRDHETCFKSFLNCQDLMFKMMPKDRKDNRYCKKLVRNIKNPTNRYYAINKVSYKTLSTIEIRLHNGTINSKEIINWTKFLTSIADKPVKKKITTVNTLNIVKPLKGYINERIKRFKTRK